MEIKKLENLTEKEIYFYLKDLDISTLKEIRFIVMEFDTDTKVIIEHLKGGFDYMKRKQKSKRERLFPKFFAVLTALILSLSFVVGLPDIYTGTKSITPTGTATGDITLYIDGDILTNADELNNILLDFDTPRNSISAELMYRVNFKGYSPEEFTASLDLSCLADVVEVKQIQESGGGNDWSLITSCYDGVDWIVIDTRTKSNEGNPLNVWNQFFEVEMTYTISEKITPSINATIVAGEVSDIDVGIYEEILTNEYGGVVSEVTNGLLTYLSYLGINVWTNEQIEEIQNYEILLSPVLVPDFIQIERGSLFLESESIELNGQAENIYETYSASDGVNDLLISDSFSGTSLIFANAGTYHLFAIYES